MKSKQVRQNSGISFVLTNGNSSMVGDDIYVPRGDKHPCISLSNKNGLTLNL